MKAVAAMERTMSDKQEIWGRLLLKGWHEFWTIKRLFFEYWSAMGREGTDGNISEEGLLRVPRRWKGRVRSGIARDMNWLSNQLFAEKRSDDELIKMMSEAGYNLETEKRDYSSKCGTTKKKQRDCLSAGAKSYVLEQCFRRDWGQVKPVRAKKQ